MDAEEQANLALFLSKVSKACENDQQLPGFIGAQVNEWLAEIDEGDKAGAAG